MMLLKRIISLFYALFFLISCPAAELKYSVPVTVEGAIFGGAADDAIQTEVPFDARWITTRDNRRYNGGLAAFCAVLCADSYFRAKDLAKGTQNRVLVNGEEDAYTQSALLESFGYTDVEFIETFKKKAYDADTNDSATFTAAYKKIGGKYDSYIFVFRGCFSIGERLSIFDVGADTDAYYALTGEHKEWTDTDSFKGLDIARGRAMEFIREYMEAHDDPECPDTVLVTGHSRGAAIANIIGAEFEDNGEVTSYTYTFNSMPVVPASCSARSYRTVFNLFDSNDLYVDPLPFAEEQYVRCGRDISVDIAGNEKVKDAIASLKGREDYISLSRDCKLAYDRAFAACFPDRASLYEMKTVTKTYDSAGNASMAADTFEKLIGSAEGLGVSDFCVLSDITEKDGEYSFTFSYCGAAILNGLAEIQAYGAPAYDAFAALFADDADGCAMAKLLNDHLGEINGGHLLINGYVLSTNSRK